MLLLLLWRSQPCSGKPAAESASALQAALPAGHPLRSEGPQSQALQQELSALADYHARISSSQPAVLDELQIGPEPSGFRDACCSISPSALCATVTAGSLPGLAASLELNYLLDHGARYPHSSVEGFWTEHLRWSESGRYLLAAEVTQAAFSPAARPCAGHTSQGRTRAPQLPARRPARALTAPRVCRPQFNSGLRVGVFDASRGTWQLQLVIEECDRPVEAPTAAFSADESLAVLQGEREDPDSDASTSSSSSGSSRGSSGRALGTHSRQTGSGSSAQDWQYLILVRMRPTAHWQLVPVRDLRSWAWLPGSRSLLIVRDGGMLLLDADSPAAAQPGLADQGEWTEVPELRGHSSWRTCLAISADGRQAAVLRESALEMGIGTEECTLAVHLVDVGQLATTSTWAGPTLRQEQTFWCVDYARHACVRFGMHGVAVWRAQAGVIVLGVSKSDLTGVLFQIPSGSAPQFSPDGHMLACVAGGQALVLHSRSGERLVTWQPVWRWPPRLPAPSAFKVTCVAWGGPLRRQLLVKSGLETLAGFRLLYSVLSLAP